MRRSTPARRARAATAALATSAFVLVPTATATATPEPGAPAGAPKNVIVLIGDGMGYNTVDLASAYQYGTTFHQAVVNPSTGAVTHVPGTASQVYQHFPVQVGQSNHSASGRAAYDPQAAWADFDWVASGATDSAAAATALATGVKTKNGVLGIAPDGTVLENLTQRADALGKATGVVTSVPFSHATPAGYAAHNANRNDLAGVTHEYLEADYLDVVIGAGHPYYDDSHRLLTTPSFGYVSQTDWQRLVDGQTGYTLLQEKGQFEALAAGADVPERVFGAVQVGSTLQQGRASLAGATQPFEAPLNDVPDLPTLTRGALNVLDREENGFFVMVEGGAIDWSGHANDQVTSIEETVDFNRAVETAVTWVEENSSWDETLLIVTADHETGYLAGAGADPTWTSLVPGGEGAVAGHTWHSGNHTNQLVPVYARGAGADALTARATGSDPVRGAYLDNTDLATVLLDELWDYVPSAGEGGVEVSATLPEQAPAGSLALSVAADAVALGDAQNLGDRLRLAAPLPTVAVTDSRTGDLGGWSVSGQATDLVGDGARLRAGYLGWSPVVLSARQGVTAGDAVTGSLDGGTGLTAPAALATADATGRTGTTQLSADLRLDVPVDSRAGTYTGTVTVTLFPVD